MKLDFNGNESLQLVFLGKKIDWSISAGSLCILFLVKQPARNNPKLPNVKILWKQVSAGGSVYH